MGNSRTSTSTTNRVTKTTCIIPEALKLWDQHSRNLRRGRGGRPNRSLALAQLIDAYTQESDTVKHAWSYSNGASRPHEELRKVNFGVAHHRLKVLEGIQGELSKVEGYDVPFGFAVTALIMHRLGSPPSTDKTAQPAKRKAAQLKRSG